MPIGQFRILSVSRSGSRGRRCAAADKTRAGRAGSRHSSLNFCWPALLVAAALPPHARMRPISQAALPRRQRSRNPFSRRSVSLPAGWCRSRKPILLAMTSLGFSRPGYASRAVFMRIAFRHRHRHLRGPGFGGDTVVARRERRAQCGQTVTRKPFVARIC